MISFLHSPTLYVVLLLLGIIVLLTFLLKWNNGKSGRRIKKNRVKGRDGEERAVKWLKKHGYKVTEQVSVHEYYIVDGDKVTYDIRPDIFATKGKEKWVLEVKTGNAASKGNRSTRRQLREYATHFPDCRLGLINGDAGKEKIHEIHFPLQKIAYKFPFKIALILIIIGVITGIALTLFIQFKFL